MKLPKLLKRIPKTPEHRKSLRQDRLLLLLSAILIGAGFSPSPAPFLLFFGLIPFFIVIERRKTFVDVNRAAFLMFFLLGFITIYWVGGFTQAKDVFLMTGGFILFFINPIMFLISSTLYFLWREFVHRRSAIFIMPFFWLFYEYLYTLTDWSFPWLQMHNGISGFVHYIQIADIIGGWGLTVLIVFTNVLFFSAWQNRSSKRKHAFGLATGAVLLIVIPLLYGVIQLSPRKELHRSINVGVTQPNIDPYDKWGEQQYDKILAQQLAKSRELLQGNPELGVGTVDSVDGNFDIINAKPVEQRRNFDLLLWPETAIPVYLMTAGYTDIQDSLYALVDSNHVTLLTGMPDFRMFIKGEKMPQDVKYSKRGGYYYGTYNSVLEFQPGTRQFQRYGKMKLVPFGEHVPFVDQFPIFGEFIKWGVGMTGWNVGKDTTVFTFKPAGFTDSVKVGAVVCYESIYSDLVTELAVKGAQCLIVVTNDSWYGNTSGPYQHRDFARLRAVETRREVVRCANGGISCFIDKFGRITKQTKMYESATLAGTVLLSDESTFYMRHPHVFISLATIFSLFCIGGAITGKMRKKALFS